MRTRARVVDGARLEGRGGRETGAADMALRRVRDAAARCVGVDALEAYSCVNHYQKCPRAWVTRGWLAASHDERTSGVVSSATSLDRRRRCAATAMMAMRPIDAASAVTVLERSAPWVEVSTSSS